MSTGSAGLDPYIGSLSRVVWQWVRRRIYGDLVAAGFDDLKPAHVAVFRNPSPEGMRPSDLADDMQITKQSINELLGHLERQGYLLREPDATDSRSRRIRLTERGRALQDAAYAAAAAAEREAAELIGADRVGELRSHLHALVQALDERGSAS